MIPSIIANIISNINIRDQWDKKLYNIKKIDEIKMNENDQIEEELEVILLINNNIKILIFFIGYIMLLIPIINIMR